LRESDEKPFRLADVAEPIRVFILDNFAHELRAVDALQRQILVAERAAERFVRAVLPRFALIDEAGLNLRETLRARGAVSLDNFRQPYSYKRQPLRRDSH